MVETGISDVVRVNRLGTQGSTDITNKLGNIQSFSYNIDNATEQYAGIGNEEKFAGIIDKCIDINGSIEMWIPNLLALQIFGTYNGDTHVITWDKKLPEFDIETNANDGEKITIEKCKFGSVTISVEDQEPISVSADYVGLSFEKEAGSVSTSVNTDAPLQGMDAEFYIGSNPIGKVSSGSITFDREIEAGRGISGSSADEKRLFTYIIEKMKNITFDMDIIITDDTAWDLVSSADERENEDIQIITTQGDISITARAGSLSVDKSSDGELRIASVSGVGIDVTINNLDKATGEE